MARPLRIEYAGAFYHVTARGNDRKKIFFTQRDYTRFKEYLAQAQERFGCVLHAYVLMGNHYHLLVETPEANLGQVMHYLNGSYTTYINVKRKRSGHLFQGRYKSIVIDKDSYLLTLSRYIHLNPVSANITQRSEDYPHSSYADYINPDTDGIVSTEQTLSLLTNKKAEASKHYRAFVESNVGADLENPLKKVYGGLVLGGERFIRRTLDRLDERQLESEDVSCRKALQAKHGIGNVVDSVCKELSCTRQLLTDPTNRRARNLTIYLLKRHTAASNRGIGQVLGGLSYSAIAKVCQRMEKQLKTDRELVKIVMTLSGELSRVKG